MMLAAQEMMRADFGASLIISLVLVAVSIVLSELLKPKPNIENARPAGLGDFKFPTAMEGRPIPILTGTAKLEGPNVIWYGDLAQNAIKETLKTGLWSKKSIVKGFRYNVGIQFGLCLGQIDALRRVWIGDTVVWTGNTQDGAIDITDYELFGGDDFGNGGVAGTLRIHSGSTTQAVNSYLSAFQTPQPAYRHLCYAVWEGGYIGNSTSIKPWKFEAQRFPNTLGLTGGKEIVNSWDANPAAAIHELLSDTRWGLGFAAADIDLADMQAKGDTLYTEGNGFSMVLDNAMAVGDYLREIERQIDGVVYLDKVSGKWKINLARADYNIDTVPQITDAKNVSLKDWNPGTWDNTVNEVRVGFDDRQRDYFSTFAVAQNVAGQKIQGKVDPVNIAYPGVKDKTLANQIASREIRSNSRPLGKATLMVDREFWELNPGDVIAWTNADLGLTKFPMRVLGTNLGTLKQGKIELRLLEDVFSYRTGFSGDPQDTEWDAPAQDMSGTATGDMLVEEAPWAIAKRDPDDPTSRDRLFCASRGQTGAISMKIYERNSSGTPSGAYSEAGEGYGFTLIGKLNAAIAKEDANPETGGGAPQIKAGDDTLANIKVVLGSTSSADIGQNLIHLCKVDDEFFAFETWTDQTTYLQLVNVHRGLLDTVPADHAVDAEVWILHAGATLSDSNIPQTNNVDVQLRPRSQTDEATEGESNTIAITMANRARRPYPPVELLVNAVRFGTGVNFDTMKTGGSTLDDRGLELTFTRRDWRTHDEVSGIATDAGTLDSSFPAYNTTEYRGEAIDDPGGTPASLFFSTWGTAGLVFLPRTKILRYKGSKPATMEVSVETRHTFESTVRTALQDLDWDFTLGASTLDNDHNWGNIAFGAVSSTWAAPQTGTYTFNIGTAMPSGAVQARINGGSWVTVIAAASVTGTLPGVTATDTIEIQHLSNTGTATETFLESVAPSGTVNAFAIMLY
jgi:hypothetical protein